MTTAKERATGRALFVHGTVTATERIEVQTTAHVHGDIVTPRLLIQEGGQLNGGIRMESAVEAPTDG